MSDENGLKSEGFTETRGTLKHNILLNRILLNVLLNHMLNVLLNHKHKHLVSSMR